MGGKAVLLPEVSRSAGSEGRTPIGTIRDFMEEQFLHFNAREALAAAEAYESHIHSGGRMLVALAGAMSTAELGISLSRMIRSGKVHAISCTGANLEEDAFNLLAHDEYEVVPDWRGLSASEEEELYRRGMNRVTDTCIPESVMRHLEARMLSVWSAACREGLRKTPADFVFEVLDDPELSDLFQIDPERSWLLAAKEMGIPVFVPGWEDSTLGNMFSANVMLGRLPHHDCVASGTDQFQRLMDWYLGNHGEAGGRPSVGFFQIGGGIAGDFAICAVPCLIQDVKKEVPFWGYFCQITDAEVSYGGYSGAVPNEKITWGKLAAGTPKFLVKSDATIVAPLIFAYVLGD
ncbi:MAG: deoxyhypusine synthase [Gemmatimonadetes bacterium]|nr:deoxyhypusine synthase family protein [Gemmatimonadota bacterium]NNM05884.1 deoxyhypusine synthase [Gemmatimonadota bacterium]